MSFNEALPLLNRRLCAELGKIPQTDYTPLRLSNAREPEYAARYVKRNGQVAMRKVSPY